jgi:hypothetical protein
MRPDYLKSRLLIEQNIRNYNFSLLKIEECRVKFVRCLAELQNLHRLMASRKRKAAGRNARGPSQLRTPWRGRTVHQRGACG